MKKILINRLFHGLGDWIMTATAIRTINLQRPDVEVHFGCNNMPSWIMNYMRNTNIKACAAINPDFKDYDGYIEHLVYPAPATLNCHLIEGMIMTLNRYLDLGLVYDASVYATYQAPRAKMLLPESYILMPAVGANNGLGDTSKEWGYQNFSTLARLLETSGHSVVQTGRKGDGSLLYANQVHYFASTAHFNTLVTRSSLVVCLENGLNHYAGHHGAAAMTLYMPNGTCKPYHTAYPKQIPMATEFMTPEYVFERVVEFMKSQEK